MFKFRYNKFMKIGKNRDEIRKIVRNFMKDAKQITQDWVLVELKQKS